MSLIKLITVYTQQKYLTSLEKTEFFPKIMSQLAKIIYRAYYEQFHGATQFEQHEPSVI